MGAGFVGMVISNDQISTLEGQVLFIWGLYIWIMGHTMLYYSEKMPHSTQGDKQ